MNKMMKLRKSQVICKLRINQLISDVILDFVVHVV